MKHSISSKQSYQTKIKNIEIDKWYKSIKKSKLTPPKYVFGIVWSILYILLAIYFIFLLKIKNTDAIIYFAIQIVLNLFWTFVFFKKRKIRLALIMIILIIFFTLLSMKEVYSSSSKAYIILVPYISWLLLAMYLNLVIILKNPYL